LRVIEEIARFILSDAELSARLKTIRHELQKFFDVEYDNLLDSRDTLNDVGCNIINPDKKESLDSIFKANFKRVEEAFRVLNQYASLDDSYRYRIYTIEKEMRSKLKLDYKKIFLNDKKLYLVTNSDNFESDEIFLDRVALSIKSGVDIVQLREKNTTSKRFIYLAQRIRELTSHFGAAFIVNDRVDIAKISNADGVHLGQDDIPVSYAREILGDNAIIGVSTHCPEHAKKAITDGADYIGVGPVFKTPTKPSKDPVGLEYVKWAADNVNIPFFAIGSIDTANIKEVVQAGAKRVAVIRAIMYADDIESNCKILKSAL
ncbi:TPA: thiamine phosphate synthase, partial [Candidatus Galligastranaerophilus gallistercoris]|nr:thiamine phosphate synthase [Candidatus Galligastranaerophilus gallistercoris]